MPEIITSSITNEVSLAKKDSVIAGKDSTIARKESEIAELRAKLEAAGL